MSASIASSRFARAAAGSLALLAVAAADAGAAGRCRSWAPAPVIGPVHGYFAIKAGGYALEALPGTDADSDGLFLGAEWGVTPSPFVEMGFVVDWLHRDGGRRERIRFDSPYELPVEGLAETNGSSTDLVPLGGQLRVRLPVADGRIVPFASGALTWDVLRLEHREAFDDGDVTIVQETSDWFFGWGSTFALGVEAVVTPGVGLVFEVGAHQAEPSKDFEIRGTPVEGFVDADGEFARIGMRFSFL